MISQRSIVAASLSATHHPDVYATRRAARCEHGIPNDRTCPECVLASWESTPRGPAPRRLREEIRRDERLERLAEDRAERREWELGDEPVPRVIPGSRRVA